MAQAHCQLRSSQLARDAAASAPRHAARARRRSTHRVLAALLLAPTCVVVVVDAFSVVGLPPTPMTSRRHRSVSSFPGASSSSPPPRDLFSTARHKRVALAPSGVDGLPEAEQALLFAGVYAGLAGGTAIATTLVDAASSFIGPFAAWRRTWPVIGALFAGIGATHLTTPAMYLAIFPPPGTWGFWALPGGADFHVAWTGYAEIAGGLGLVVGAAAEQLLLQQQQGETALTTSLARLKPLSAKALFLLTLAVTPANIYMWSHGATMPGAGPDGPLPVTFHYVRFAFQVVLLTIFASIAKDDSLLDGDSEGSTTGSSGQAGV